MKLTTKTVAIKVQGISREIDVTAFHQDAIDAVFTYGARRWFQDHINSAAKARRENGETITDKWTSEAFDARLDQALTGEITMRNGVATDPLDAYRIAVMRAVMKDEKHADVKAAHDAIDSADQKARREYLLETAASSRFAKAVEAKAVELRDIDDARNAALSELDIAV